MIHAGLTPHRSPYLQLTYSYLTYLPTCVLTSTLPSNFTLRSSLLAEGGGTPRAPTFCPSVLADPRGWGGTGRAAGREGRRASGRLGRGSVSGASTAPSTTRGARLRRVGSLPRRGRGRTSGPGISEPEGASFRFRGHGPGPWSSALAGPGPRLSTPHTPWGSGPYPQGFLGAAPYPPRFSEPPIGPTTL